MSSANVGFRAPTMDPPTFRGGSDAQVGYQATSSPISLDPPSYIGRRPTPFPRRPVGYQPPVYVDDDGQGFYDDYDDDVYVDNYQRRRGGTNLSFQSRDKTLTLVLTIAAIVIVGSALILYLWKKKNEKRYVPPSSAPTIDSVLYNKSSDSYFPYFGAIDGENNVVETNGTSVQEYNPNSMEHIEARLKQIASMLDYDLNGASFKALQMNNAPANANEMESLLYALDSKMASNGGTVHVPLHYAAAAAGDDGGGGADKKIIRQSIVSAAICPTDKYDADMYLSNGIARCNKKCPEGFESMWFEPIDRDGKRMTRTILVTDNEGKPVMIPGPDGKPVQKTREEEIAPEAWCRAICPIKLVSKNGSLWDSRMSPSSHFMNADAVASKTVGSKYIRTDAGDGDLYCRTTIYDREIQKGGQNFVCGWCTKTLGSMDGNGTSTNRHNCSSANMQYHIDFTDWCMKRRLVPNWLPQELNVNTKQENNLNVPFCSALNGQQSSNKHVKMVQGPKACYNGDLLPVQPAAYIKGKLFNGTLATLALTSTNYLISEGAVKFNPNQIVLSQDTINYSYFLEACYSKCPIWMVPYGPIENHQCIESCPPNTSIAEGLGQTDLCKKHAFVKENHIPDLLSAVRAISQQMANKVGGVVS